MPSKTAPVYQLKITLDGFRPPIWRRILVPGNLRLGRLHDAIQAAMGWSDYHLHQFEIDGDFYGDLTVDESEDLHLLDEQDERLKDLGLKARSRFRYEYDFGDGWQHTLLVEKVLLPDSSLRTPVCLDGARACPPEDVGGIHGYRRFLQAIRHPRDPEHDEDLEWVGGAFDPEAFDLEAANRRLRRPKRSGAMDTDAWAPALQPLLPKPPAETVAEDDWLEAFNRQYGPAADSMRLRQDMLIFLGYLQANRVTGTQATGNLPLKAAEAICASLSTPIPFGDAIGDRFYKARSASEVWPLYFLHILASVSNMLEGGPGRRWQVTGLGEGFQRSPAGLQVWTLLLIWLHRVNWEIAAPFVPPGLLDERLRLLARQHLLALPPERSLPFDLFADQLISAAGLIWAYGDEEYRRSRLHHIIEYSIARPLRDLGVLELTFSPDPTLGADFPQTSALMLTPIGRAMLERLNRNLA